MNKFDPFECDVRRFSRMAREGEIPSKAIPLFAKIIDAVRDAHKELGPGRLAIRPLLDAFPVDYIQNYLLERKARG